MFMPATTGGMLVPQPPSLAGRAFAAVALLVGFYVLALAVAGALAYIPYADWQDGGGFSARAAFFCGVSSVIILWSIVPRPDRFDAPGPRLTPQTQPRLFALLRNVALATRQEMPAEVYAVPDLNAWVAQRGGVMGYGSRRVMGLGLPLMSHLSVAQFSAVLAHEFGHYYGGDTKLGPWIYKTQSAIGRTLDNLSQHSGLLSKPFEWYGLLFLRITHAVSRAQEFSADALAARTVGGRALGDGLKTIHGIGPAFDAYWNQEYAPLLTSGYRAPYREGFQAFLATPAVAAAVAETLAHELQAPGGHPHDTHPPLPERLRALPDTDTLPRWNDDRAAITLLEDVGTVEAELIAWVVGPDAAGLKPLAWADAPRDVWAPEWRRLVEQERQRLAGMTPATLLGLPDAPGALAVALGLVAEPQRATDNHLGSAVQLFGSALAVALLDRGWEVKSGPGEPIGCWQGVEHVEPFEAWPRIAEGSLSRADWERLITRTGIAAIDLGVAST